MTRQAIATIPEAQLVDVLTGAQGITNIPHDAKLLSAWIDTIKVNGEHRRYLRMRLEHESFEPVEDGGRIPTLEVQAGRREPRKPAASDEKIADAQQFGGAIA
jgi:hypothetical protein